MKKTIVFATGNAHKMEEIRMILADPQVSVYSMKELGIQPEIVEDGKTFEENAQIKANTVYAELMRLVQTLPQQYGQYADAVVLADDSGLEIDYLNGEPGIYSSRYLGEDTSYEVKNRIILSRMQGVEEAARSARFVCAIAAAGIPAKQTGAAHSGAGAVATDTAVVRETMEGRVAYAPEGIHGFGYDPIFFLPEYGCTSAVLAPEQKNACSHRGKALRAIRGVLFTKD